jgi:hypothetical protein
MPDCLALAQPNPPYVKLMFEPAQKASLQQDCTLFVPSAASCSDLVAATQILIGRSLRWKRDDWGGAA